jgi:tetratricopeptide (TPR) repeat protein
MRKKMPKRVPNHVTGDKAIAALQNYFPEIGWTFETVEKDYGLDAKIEVFEDGEASGFIFFVQSKGTEVEKIKSRQIAEYFKEEEANYFTSLNMPILIVQYSVVDKTVFAKWAYSDLSFEKTPTRYKVVFSTKDIISDNTLDLFIESVKFLESIARISTEETIKIELSGNVSDTLPYTKFFNHWSSVLGLPFAIVESSPIKFIFTKKDISIHIFGIIDEVRSNSLDNLLSILENISKGINNKLIYQIKILQLIHSKSSTTRDIISLGNQFRNDIDYLSISNKIEEDQNGFLEIFRPLVSVLQLLYFSLNKDTREKIKNLREKKYIATKNPEDLINYLLVLQSENNKSEIAHFLDDLKPDDNFFIENERITIEYANFARLAGYEEEALRIISLCVSEDEDVIYLKARLLIQLGRYKDSMKEFEKIDMKKKKSTDFLVLYTMSALLVNVFGIESQLREKNSDTLDKISNGSQALEYIKNFDALEPSAWLSLAEKDPDELTYLNESEFYTAFSSLFSKDPQHFARSINFFIRKIYYDEDSDIPTLKITLTNIIEEALTAFGKRFLDDVLEMLLSLGYPDEIVNDIARSIKRIEEAHANLNNFKISDKGSGFIGNTIYRPSIINSDL